MLLYSSGILLICLLIKIVFAEPLLRTCEPIRVELCANLGYNMTGMPNLGGNDLQQEADYTLKSFSPLIQYGCSSQLKLFLCAVYVPMCTEKVINPIGPCRGLCENVRSRCYPVLKGFGFPWPDALNCSRFPVENNHEHMCMEGPHDRGTVDITAPVDPAIQKFDCDRNFIRNHPTGNCVPICESNLMFDESEKNFAEVWVTVWALICLITSLASALTLSIGGGRIKARPLVSLALCYCMISAGWNLRMFSGRMSACHQHQDLSSNNNDEDNFDGLSNVNCAFVFLMIYYFGMAANAWWVSLCVWWMARVGLSWPPEKLRSLGSFLHVGAWGLPAIQTVAALVLRDVDSDYLTGTCYIGNRNNTTLLTLVLIPDTIYLLMGISFLMFGFIYLMKKPRPTAATPLTATTPRKESDFLGAICTLYIIPTICVTATIYYEYNNRGEWLSGTKRPALWAFLLRHLMSLFIGVSSIFWIWSMKTVTAWRSLMKRLRFLRSKQLPIKKQQQQQQPQTMPVLRYATTAVPIATAAATSTTNHQSNLLSCNLSTTSRHSSRSHSHRKPRVVVHQLRCGGGGIGGGGETII